tara:strand:+ start:3295 stop:3753 length:459 start_codon:yes stop_codon:yes gene_type:complete
MNIISHRGNLNGPDPRNENTISQIQKAKDNGFDVEVDVWWYKENFWLGHDEPEQKILKSFLTQGNLWVHAKNLEAVKELQYVDTNWFWHENDKVTLTRRGNIWCFPGNEVDGGIMVDNGPVPYGQAAKVKVQGVCTDYPLRWKNENSSITSG